MNPPRKIAAIVFFLAALGTNAAEFTIGRIRLLLNENTGRFLMYFLSDVEKKEYLPFFSDADPGTSFLTLIVNDRTYKLGEASAFKISFDNSDSSPAFIFESPAVSVIQRFHFIQTPNATEANGVQISVSVNNKGDKSISAGIRFLLDTRLGEKGEVHFFTDRRLITNETLIGPNSDDTYWISGSGSLGCMGSFSVSGFEKPDAVYFANRYRFNETPWKLAFWENRAFDALPYPAKDTAACYYYEPVPLAAGQTREMFFFLASKDVKGFAQNDIVKIVNEQVRREQESMREDMAEIRRLTELVDQYLSSGASNDKIAAVEQAVSRLKTKYGL